MPETATKKNWTRVAFGDVVRLSRERSRDLEAEGFERYVGLEHLEPRDSKVRSWGNVADGTTFTKIFRSGQVLFGKRRAYQRKVAVADFSGVCSGDIYVFEPKSELLLPELLPFICQTDAFFDHAVRTSAGSLSPRTNWKSLAGYEFALPPIGEQQSIAAALSIFDALLDRLIAAELSIKRLKASMLEALFPIASVSASVELSSLIEAGSLELQTGPFGTVLSASEYTDSGWPIVNPTDMRNDHIVQTDATPCVSDQTATRLDKYRMMEGDILLARKGEIDKASIVSPSHEGWIVGSDCIRLRCLGPDLLPAVVRYFLQAPRTARMLLSHAHGTVMPGLNEKMLGRLQFDQAPIREQEERVSRLRELDNQLVRVRERIVELKGLRMVVLGHILQGDTHGLH